MPDPRHELGLAAEAATARWLTAHGWEVLARRWRHGTGELDLVALDPDAVLVGIEVRARRTARAGHPAVTVDGRRVSRLRAALAAHAVASRAVHRGLRLDLVTAEPLPGQPQRWRLIRLPAIG